MRSRVQPSNRRRRGSTQIEFALVCVQLVVLLLAMFEFGRMVLVYSTVANAAKTGLRYAIVHGSMNTAGSGADGPSGPGNPCGCDEVKKVVTYYATQFALDASKLETTVTYPDASNIPGSRVAVPATAFV